MTVNSPEGEAIIRSIQDSREILYHIKWKEAQVDLADKGAFAGRMDDVSGEFYKNGKVASTFQADHAQADKETQVLTLRDHVTVVSKTQATTMACDKLEWHAGEKIVKAYGNIRMVGKFGTLKGLEELWSRSDLTYFSTPSMFKKS